MNVIGDAANLQASTACVFLFISNIKQTIQYVALLYEL